jgi:hypothetical protein
MIEGAKPAEPPAVITKANVEGVLAARGQHGPNFGLLPHSGALRDEFRTSHKKGIGCGIGLRLDPLLDNSDFDWESVYAHCDGEFPDCPINPAEAQQRRVVTLAAKMVSAFTGSLLTVSPSCPTDRKLARIGRVALAIAGPQHGVTRDVLRFNFGKNWQHKVARLRAEFAAIVRASFSATMRAEQTM